MSNNIYMRNGYTNREAYVLEMADEYDVSADGVRALINLLGDEEAFDGVVSGMDELMEMESGSL